MAVWTVQREKGGNYAQLLLCVKFRKETMMLLCGISSHEKNTGQRRIDGERSRFRYSAWGVWHRRPGNLLWSFIHPAWKIGQLLAHTGTDRTHQHHVQQCQWFGEYGQCVAHMFKRRDHFMWRTKGWPTHKLSQGNERLCLLHSHNDQFMLP